MRLAEHVRRRPWIAALAVVAAVVVIVLARPYDGALNRDAASGTQWTDHLVRAEVALARAEGRDGTLGWLVAADQGFPPLIHWVAVPLGDTLGRDAGVVERFGLLWLLILVAATGVLGAAVTGDRATGALAAASLATFPAIHGAALGYFYDLPMTALLFAAGAVLLAGGARRPVLAGVAAGGLFVVACLAKWTALALAPPLVLGIFLVARAGERRGRAVSAAIAAAVAGVGVAGFLAVSSKSLLAMAGTAYMVDQGGGSSLGATLHRIFFLSGGPLSEALVFLPVRLVIGAVGPALSCAVLLAAGVWVVRSRAGAWLVASVVIGDVFVIHRFFPALNDRWLISVVPVLAIAAAAGIVALPWARMRAAAACLLVGIGLAGTWDFHHGATFARDRGDSGDNPDWNDLRAWSAASSTEPQLGWARADYREGPFLANRESLWAAIVRCEARDVLLEEPGVSGSADAPWWRYRDTLHRLDTSAPLRHIATLGGPEMTAPAAEGDATAVALLRYERREEDPPPSRIVPGWTLRAVVPGWKGSPAVGLWTPRGAATCGAFDP